MLTDYVNNNSLKLKINLGDLVLFIIFTYSIIFYGGVIPIRPISQIFSSIPLFFFIIFELVSPALFGYLLHNKYQHKTLDIQLSYDSFIITFLAFIFILSGNIDNLNLFSDEYYYVQTSFFLSFFFLFQFYSKFDLAFLDLLPANSLLQIVSLSQWVLVFFIFYYFKNNNSKNRVFAFIILMILLRLVVNIVLNVRGGPHPPMLYFFPNIFGAIFGITDISMKLSNCLGLFIFLLYLFHRIKFSFFEKLIIGVLISFIPFISYQSLLIDQTIYSFICFAVIALEIILKKPKPRALFFFLAIMCSFRQTSIAAIPALSIYTVYYYSPLKDIKKIVLKVLDSSIPLILYLPIFLNSVILGTPTTKNTALSVDKNIDLIYNAYNAYDLYLFFPLFIVFFMMYKRKYIEMIFLVSILISYLFLQYISSTYSFQSKYYFELYGWLIVVAIILFVKFTYNYFKNISFTKMTTLFLGICLLFHLFSVHYYQKKFQKYNQPDFWKFSENFIPTAENDNHLDFCIDYLKTNNIVGDTFVLGSTYGAFPLLLNGCSLSDIKKYYKLQKLYLANKNKDIYVFDAKAINETKEIKYLLITDSLKERHQQSQDLIESVNWTEIFSLPLSKNHHSIILLKRI